MKSFLTVDELIFKPYDALDLQKILTIRVKKALRRHAAQQGVIEKIAAMAAVIGATQKAKEDSVGTGDVYNAYKRFCDRDGLRPLTRRAGAICSVSWISTP